MLEALSYGLPVIASDIPANVEVGLAAANYFTVGDVAALAQRLYDFAQVPQAEAERIARRTAVAARYDWDVVADRA